MNIFTEIASPEETWKDIFWGDRREGDTKIYAELGDGENYAGVWITVARYPIDNGARPLIPLFENGILKYGDSDGADEYLNAETLDPEGFYLTPYGETFIKNEVTNRLTEHYSSQEIEDLSLHVETTDGGDSDVAISFVIPYDETGTVSDVENKYSPALSVLEDYAREVFD